jgi:hypothetical protein
VSITTSLDEQIKQLLHPKNLTLANLTENKVQKQAAPVANVSIVQNNTTKLATVNKTQNISILAAVNKT